MSLNLLTLVKRKNTPLNYKVKQSSLLNHICDIGSALRSPDANYFRHDLFRSHHNTIHSVFNNIIFQRTEAGYDTQIDILKQMLEVIEQHEPGTISILFRRQTPVLEYYDSLLTPIDIEPVSMDVPGSMDPNTSTSALPSETSYQTHDDPIFDKIRTFSQLLNGDSQNYLLRFKNENRNILARKDNPISNDMLIKLLVFQQICQYEIKLQLYQCGIEGNVKPKTFVYILSRNFFQKIILKEIISSPYHLCWIRKTHKRWSVKRLVSRK